jgi:hypothetical protein
MRSSRIARDEPGTTACRPNLSTCQLCGHGSFRLETETTKTRWGFRNHIKTLLVCNGCRYVVTFYDRASSLDVDVRIG